MNNNNSYFNCYKSKNINCNNYCNTKKCNNNNYNNNDNYDDDRK